MSTPLKRLTNRLNSRKSTGPRSLAGKRIVAQSPIRHGMLANSIVLEGESVERFKQMSENFHDEHQPQSETELALIDMMCASRWRQMRIWGIERAAVTQEMLNQVAQLAAHDTSVEVRLDTPAKAALGFRSLADNSRTLDLINRYEGSNSRLFFRSLRQLMALRANPELPENEPEDLQEEAPASTPTTAQPETRAPAAVPPGRAVRTPLRHPRNPLWRSKAKYSLSRAKSTIYPLDKAVESRPGDAP
jgi:hypothetical protein